MKIVKKINSGAKNTMKDFINAMETLIYKNIRGNYPSYWDEDVLNLCLIKDMSTLFNDKKIRVPSNIIRSNWKLYKMNQESENKFGDIAVILNITYHDGYNNEGAIFLEAHRKDPDKNTFSTIKSNILKRVASNAPHAQLLLYDYDNISGMAFAAVPDSIIGDYPDSWKSWIPFTHAAAVPVNAAIALGQKTTGLYKVSIPFSYQLCCRYLYGLDLDYQTVAVETARGQRSDKGNAKYLIVLSVAHGGAEFNTDIEINKDMYSELV